MGAAMRIGCTVVSLSCAVVVASGCGVGSRAGLRTAGFWFDPAECELPADLTARYGGALAPAECEEMERIARGLLERAFSGLALHISDDRRAFWRVEVLRTLPIRRRQPFPHAGESIALGLLGGRGAVNLQLVALDAVHYARPGASRAALVAAMGRGIGHVAVHEFTHQVLGARSVHNDEDIESYEYSSPDRAAQYYGELHWTTARPLLEQRLGRQP